MNIENFNVTLTHYAISQVPEQCGMYKSYQQCNILLKHLQLKDSKFNLKIKTNAHCRFLSNQNYCEM